MFLKRVLAIFIGLLMMLQTTAVFAGTFNDLKDSEWAESYIEKMASKGIITGFNGAYKPVEPVNKYSAVVMIYRTLKAAGKLDDAAVNAAVSKYSAVLSTNKVPAWPDLHQAVAWMLENGVVQQDELKYFMSGDNHINARRYELSIFLGKALNVFLKENVNTFISLSFKDANLISSGSAPYVNLLVGKKILNGDLDGNFKPYDPMNRAAMAKVLSLSYDVLSQGTSTVTPPPVTVPTDTTSKTGVISYVLSDTQKVIIADKNDSSKTEIYSVPSDAKIYITNSPATFSDLKKNMEVTLTLSGTKVTRVTVGSFGSDINGVLKSIENMNGYYLITLKDDADEKTKEISTVSTFKKASLDGALVDPMKINAGDKIKISVNEYKQAISLEVTTKTKSFEGILKSQSLYNGKPTIVIKLSNTEEKALELDSTLSVRRNDKTAELVDVIPGDYITVKTYFDKVVRIEAYSAATKKLSGNIEQITIGRTNKLSIKNDDGVIKDYEVSPNVELKLDSKTAEIYELRMNYRVEIELQGTTLVKIAATKTASKDQVSGRVSKIYSDLGIITIRNMIGTTEQFVSVTVNGTTKIITSSGVTRSIGNIEVGDSIFVYGNYYDTFFLAEKIIMLE